MCTCNCEKGKDILYKHKFLKESCLNEKKALIYYLFVYFSVGKSERHVRFEKAGEEQKHESNSEEEEDEGPTTLQARLLRLAGQAKGDKTSEMVNCVLVKAY